MISNIETTAGAQDFARLTDLQQQFSKTDNELTLLEAKMNDLAQRSASCLAADYVVLQERSATLDAQIKALFTAHPEWRGDKKSVKTPFGEVSQRTVTELVIPNEPMTVALIEAQMGQDAADYLRIEKSPNVEALEALSNDLLAKLGVSRKSEERVTVKPAKISVSKTVKAAKAKEVAS